MTPTKTMTIRNLSCADQLIDPSYDPRQWVVVRDSDNKIKFWRDYGHVAWGSPAYEVLGYFRGSYATARQWVAKLTSADTPWDCIIQIR